MAYLIYIDNSNLWIEGQRVAAVRNGLVPDIHSAIQNRIVDTSFRVNLGNLKSFTGGNQVKSAVVFGSRPPASDDLWKVMQRLNMEPVIVDRSIYTNKEKKVDTGLVARMTKEAYKLADPTTDTIVLVAGDSDYVPCVQELVDDGFRVEVMFWDHASGELKGVASEFVSLNDHFDFLKLS